MRTPKFLIAVLSLSILAACSTESDRQASTQSAQTAKSEPTSPDTKSQGFQTERVHLKLDDAGKAQSFDELNRKIIKDADLTLEVDSPMETMGRVTTIAEAHGGFIVTSESKQRPSSDPSQRVVDVSLVIRVPSSQFGPTRDEILTLSKNVLDKKSTGQDVTEEFMDLEARIKTQTALEAQFMEIMKQAHKVEDALEVQRQIAEVRTEIEKLEGRKRLLENRSSLSTITVNLKSPTTVLVSPSGFGREIMDAAKESVAVAREIVLFLIRFVIVMIPIGLFIVLPLTLVFRYLIRRARRLRIAEPLTAPAPAPQG